MNRNLRVVVLSGLAAGSIWSAACATSIRDVVADPARYRDREVTIKGEVLDSLSVMARGIYRVRDNSGQLWVVSSEGVPRKGAQVTVKGTVRDAFNLGAFGVGLQLPAGVGSGVILVEDEHTAHR